MDLTYFYDVFIVALLFPTVRIICLDANLFRCKVEFSFAARCGSLHFELYLPEENIGMTRHIILMGKQLENAR